MNELLQKHGCSNVFTVPEGLKELMSDITREVLREQPTKVYEFISNYLSVLLITREHGILAVKILDDLCDCKPSISEHLLQLGMPRTEAEVLAQVIKDEIEGFEPVEGKEKVREAEIIKKLLRRLPMDEDMVAQVCHIARNAYRDYWYRKKLLEQSLKVRPEEPWEIAAQHTLEIYKKTKPSFSELNRATQKIQAAYRGYHVRRNLLRHLKPKPKKTGPKVELLGPPIDIAESRDIDLGRVIKIKVKEDDVDQMFDEHASHGLGLKYDPMKTITHVEDEEDNLYPDDDVRSISSRQSRLESRMMSAKSMVNRSEMPTKPKYSEDFGAKQTGATGKMEDLTPAKRVDIEIDDDSYRQQSVGSQVKDTTSQQKISFASEPGEKIIDDEDEPVAPQEAIDNVEIIEVPEVIDDYDSSEVGRDMPEGAPEIPEDLPDDHTEGEPSVVSSSGPQTADDVATDVEDTADMGVTEDEDEGN